MASARTLVETEQLALRDIACGAPRGGPGAVRGGESTHVVLVRRGAFVAHVGRRQYVADACTALISWADTDYRLSHPGDGGDDCLVVELGAELEGEALAKLRRHREIELRLSPRLLQRVAGFAASVRVPDSARACRHGGACGRSHPPAPAPAPAALAVPAPLATEERSLELLQALLEDRSDDAPRAFDRARQQLARRAVAALHRDLAASPSVASLAAELQCSPFQLMRAMRAELGTTLRGYRIAARLGAALHRLAEGEADLTRLALELGFASHAHLTGSFVRIFGAPPSQLRAGLGPRARTFLEAHRAATL